MSRQLTPNGLASANVRVTEEAWLVLLKLTGSVSGGTTHTFRIVNNLFDVQSSVDGSTQTYTAYGFDIVLSETDPQTPPVVKITIDNVDQMLTDALRNIDEQPTVDLWVILASQPNSPELSIRNMKLANVTFDAEKIQGNLVVEDFLSRKFPSLGAIYDPRQFPGLF